MSANVTRWITICAGFATAAILTAEVFVVVPGSSRDPTMFDFVHVWSMAWFFANAVRFFDTHDERWFGRLSLLGLGFLSLYFGIAQFNNLELPIASSNAKEASLAASASIVAIAALASALRPSNGERWSDWSFDPVGSVKRDPLRWATIASGILLAAFIFTSPATIPIAVAATCAVRYTDTMPGPGRIRLRLVTTAAVVSVLAAFIFELWGGTYGHATLPVAMLMVACIAGVFRRRDPTVGTDRNDFNISPSGVLTFDDSPDHEDPDDATEDCEVSV